MGNVMKAKIRKYHIAIVITFMCVVFAIVGLFGCYINNMDDERFIRIEVNSLLTRLNETGLEKMENVQTMEDFPFTIYKNDGTVIFDTTGKYAPLQKIDLVTVGATSQYVVPIIHNGENEGILQVNCENYLRNKRTKIYGQFLGIVISGILILLCILQRENQLMKRDFWKPLEKLHDSTKKILSGNYNENVFYDFEGEIGTLCHDFEKMRDNLANSQKMELEMKNKEQLLYASISHDLKTPIAIVKGHLEEIAFEVVTDKEQMKKAVENCLAKINGIGKLTDDILAHSKAELGQLSINMQEVYADEYFGMLMKQLESDAKSGGYQLFYDIPDRFLVELDPDRINEVVFNIIGNSVKYSGNDLKIEISFTVQDMGKRVLIMMIKDNGFGIEAIDLPFVFDLFYRGNKSRTQDTPGSGLGLHISKYIIEKHGGNIECDSIAGVGTTISFSIPIL